MARNGQLKPRTRRKVGCDLSMDRFDTFWIDYDYSTSIARRSKNCCFDADAKEREGSLRNMAVSVVLVADRDVSLAHRVLADPPPPALQVTTAPEPAPSPKTTTIQ